MCSFLVPAGVPAVFCSQLSNSCCVRGIELMFLLAVLWHQYRASISRSIFFRHSAGFDQCFFSLSENQEVSKE